MEKKKTNLKDVIERLKLVTATYQSVLVIPEKVLEELKEVGEELNTSFVFRGQPSAQLVQQIRIEDGFYIFVTRFAAVTALPYYVVVGIEGRNGELRYSGPKKLEELVVLE